MSEKPFRPADRAARVTPAPVAEEPKFPEPHARYGGPDLDDDTLAEAERVMAQWPAAEQDLTAAVAWVRGWRP